MRISFRYDVPIAAVLLLAITSIQIARSGDINPVIDECAIIRSTRSTIAGSRLQLIAGLRLADCALVRNIAPKIGKPSAAKPTTGDDVVGLA